MRYLILGAGLQSQAIAHYLLGHEDTEQIIVLDAKRGAANNLAKCFNDDRVMTMQHDVRTGSTSSTRQYMALADVIISALPYELNYDMSELVVAIGNRSFVDLGGNNDIERAQIGLSREACDRNVAIAPAQGIAPGAVSVLTAHLMDKLGGERFDSVRIFAGGIPKWPMPPIGYSLVFSVHGLFNEYLEMAEVLKGGRRQLVESVTDIENIKFPTPYGGVLEAALTSGGSSTLTRTFEGLVNDLEYRTLRWPGHWKIIKMLKSLGFLSMRPEDNLRGVMPRMMTEHVFGRNLPQRQEDTIVLRVSVASGPRTATFDMTVLPNQATGLSAMQQTTGFSAAIVARMLARGVIKKRGTLTTELDVPPKEFLNEWQGCGFNWTIRQT